MPHSRKRKSSSEIQSSGKVSATGSRCANSSKTHVATESGSLVGDCAEAAAPLRRRTCISCECHQATGRRRCSASPVLRGQEGKENELRTALESAKQERQAMDYEGTGKNIFPDDDSNQILPVEQFFGNMDIVQDHPEGSSATSAHVQGEHRRRHFYAREDSDEEEAGFSSSQQSHRGGVP